MTTRSARLIAASTLVAFALAAPALASDDRSLVWTLLDVHAYLNNDGAVRVRETHHVDVKGAVPTIQREFALDADQTMWILGVWQRPINEAPREPLTAGDPTVPGQYAFRHGQLEWNVGAIVQSDAPVSRIYEVEYEMTNVVSPAWSLGAGPRPMVFMGAIVSPAERWAQNEPRLSEAWPLLSRAYRFDHDVLFPNINRPADDVVQIDYHLYYDTAWRMITPEEQFGKANPDVDYRVRVVLEYLRPGQPPAANLRNSAIRMGAIVALPLVGVGLLLVSVLGSTALWRMPRIDGDWMAQHLLQVSPDAIRAELGTEAEGQSFESLLTRMASARKVSVQLVAAQDEEEPPKVSMRLMAARESLPPLERAVVDALFVNGSETSTDIVQQHYRDEGLYPDDLIEDGVDAAARGTSSEDMARAEKAVSQWRPIASTVSLILIVGGLVLLVFDIVSAGQPPIAIAAGLILNSVVSEVIWRGRGGWLAGSRIADVVLILPLAMLVIAITAMHVMLSQPLSIYASAGLAAMSLGFYQAILNKKRPVIDPARRERQRELTMARRFAWRELRKPRPALEDSWIPHLEALGLASAIDTWRRRYGVADAAVGTSQPEPVAMFAQPFGRFTGTAPGSIDLPPGWTDGFVVWEGEQDTQSADV